MSARKIWVAGHKGMVGSAITRCLAKRGDEVLKADREMSICAIKSASRPGCGKIVPTRSYLLPPGSAASTPTTPSPPTSSTTIWSSKRTSFTLRTGRYRPSPIPRFVLHLSEVCAAADQRGRAAHRPAGTDQPMVCDRQDRRDQALPSLPQATRPPLHLGHALQSLWARRQLRSADQSRSAGAHSQVSRGEGGGGRRTRRMGNGHAVA